MGTQSDLWVQIDITRQGQNLDPNVLKLIQRKLQKNTVINCSIIVLVVWFLLWQMLGNAFSNQLFAVPSSKWENWQTHHLLFSPLGSYKAVVEGGWWEIYKNFWMTSKFSGLMNWPFGGFWVANLMALLPNFFLESSKTLVKPQKQMELLHASKQKVPIILLSETN